MICSRCFSYIGTFDGNVCGRCEKCGKEVELIFDREEFDIARQLIASDPENDRLKRIYCLSLKKDAQTASSGTADSDFEISVAKEGVRLSSELSEKYPGNKEFSLCRAVMMTTLADWYAHKNREASIFEYDKEREKQELELYNGSIDILRSLVKDEPGEFEYKKALGMTLCTYGSFCYLKSEFDMAYKLFDECITITEALIKERPEDELCLSRCAWALRTTALMLMKKRRIKQMIEYYDRLLVYAETLVDICPQNKRYISNLAVYYYDRYRITDKPFGIFRYRSLNKRYMLLALETANKAPDMPNCREIIKKFSSK